MSFFKKVFVFALEFISSEFGVIVWLTPAMNGLNVCYSLPVCGRLTRFVWLCSTQWRQWRHLEKTLSGAGLGLCVFECVKKKKR